MKLVHQTASSINNLFGSAAFILTIVSFASCTITDLPEPDPDPQDNEITFQVELVKMTALEIKSGEGEQLEIYGSVIAKLVRDNVTETNTVWLANDPTSFYQGVGLNDQLINESTSFTVLESNLETSSIDLIAALSDWDSATNPAEFLGEETISTPLSAITNTLTLQVVLNDSGGQIIQVTYTITRM